LGQERRSPSHGGCASWEQQVKSIALIATAFLTMAMPQVASAGCNIEVTFQNRASHQAYVKWFYPYVVASLVNPAPLTVDPPRINVFTRINPNRNKKKSFEIPNDCAEGFRMFHFTVDVGGETKIVTKVVAVQLDRKFNVRIRD
jgi:hypothetical protein